MTSPSGYRDLLTSFYDCPDRSAHRLKSEVGEEPAVIYGKVGERKHLIAEGPLLPLAGPLAMRRGGRRPSRRMWGGWSGGGWWRCLQ